MPLRRADSTNTVQTCETPNSLVRVFISMTWGRADHLPLYAIVFREHSEISGPDSEKTGKGKKHPKE
jgi:hypothetical protein